MTGAGHQAGDGFARVPVPRAVYDGLEAVRRSGLTNMLDRPRVAELALELGHPDAAAWIHENRADYARAILLGIRPDDEPDSEPDRLLEALTQIAHEEMGIETLVERGRDRLDFHEFGVAGLRRALERAFGAGRSAPWGLPQGTQRQKHPCRELAKPSELWSKNG